MPNQTISKPKLKNKFLFAPGHRACAGCGQAIAAKTVVEALGPETIIANATGCLEVTTTPYPESSWGMPWVHSLFENAAAIATGVSAALKQKGIDKKIKVVAQGGDGSTYDIGFGLISGMWERGDNILYICYDNEAYSNTGMQASGATPTGASTTTTPPGTQDLLGATQKKKDMMAIALAHRVPYVASTSVGFLADIVAKVKKAAAVPGPSYLQILVPCVPGWGIKPEQTMVIGKLAIQTGLYPALEYTNGELTGKMKVPATTPLVDEFFKTQSRFSHLFKSDEGKKLLAELQILANNNISKYGLK